MEGKIRAAPLDSFHLRLIYMGLFMNLIAPLSLLGIGFILRHSAFLGEQHLDVELIMFILLGVSLIGLIVIWFFKKRWLASPESLKMKRVEQIESSLAKVTSEKTGLTFALVIYSLCLSPSIYGFVGFLLGGSLSWFILFMAMTLAGFLLFKPKEEELKKFYSERFEVG